MSDVNKQDCIHKRIPQCTKTRICILHQRTLLSKATGYMKILIYIGYISENAILTKFFVILQDIP